MSELKDIRDVKELRGKRVLVRASLNAPLQNDRTILDPFRLEKALQTIQYLANHDAKVIVVGHLGRDPHETLAPIAEFFKQRMTLTFVEDIVGPLVDNTLKNMRNGDVVLLENTRREHGETTNDEAFSRQLASHADLFVHDAFSVAHRKHASSYGVAHFLPTYAGFLFQSEYKELEKARHPKAPSLFILGGAKFETKRPLIEQSLAVYDHVFVTGALANDFFQSEGFEVGLSYVSNPKVDVKHLLKHSKIVLPIDVTVETKEGTKEVKDPKQVLPTDMINDIGPKTIAMMRPLILGAEFILWNGPTGDYTKGFEKGTKSIADTILESKVETVVGGGDTMALITKYGYQTKFSFCSTAGGAMLEYLQKGTLPGIEAIKNSPETKNG